MLTLQMGLSPEYVLDKIEWYEINALMKYQYYSIKDNWEQARLIAFMIAQTNSKRKLKLQDIVPFVWEEEEIEEVQPITKTEIERLKAKAQDYLSSKNNQIEKRN